MVFDGAFFFKKHRAVCDGECFKDKGKFLKERRVVCDGIHFKKRRVKKVSRGVPPVAAARTFRQTAQSCLYTGAACCRGGG